MATSLDQTDYVKTALRLPRRLHRQLTAEAAKHGRSLNAELIIRLEASSELPPVLKDPQNFRDLGAAFLLIAARAMADEDILKLIVQYRDSYPQVASFSKEENEVLKKSFVRSKAKLQDLDEKQAELAKNKENPDQGNPASGRPDPTHTTPPPKKKA